MKNVVSFVACAVCSAIVVSLPVQAGNDYKGFPSGYCTYYAAQEFDKVAPQPKQNWRGNAQDWVRNAADKGWKTTTNPREAVNGACIVWSGGGFGHVAVVRRVASDGLNIDEMNWGKLTDAREGKTENFGKTSSAFIKFSSLDRGASYRFSGIVLPSQKQQGGGGRTRFAQLFR